MNRTAWMMIACGAGMMALVACGSSSSGVTTTSSSGDLGGSTTVSSSSGTTDAASSTSTGTATSSSSGGTGGSATVNNCDPSTATDDTAMTAVTIDFGGATGFAYSPNCIKVKSGTTVTFSGTFSAHPLVGGVVAAGVETPAKTGTTPFPITPMNTGTTATFTMSTAGTFGYYCEIHGAADGMDGAVIVE